MEPQASESEHQAAHAVMLHNVTSHWAGPSNYDVGNGSAAQTVHGPSAKSSSAQKNAKNTTEVIPLVSASFPVYPNGKHFHTFDVFYANCSRRPST